jgi:acetyl esterase/lipase
MPGLIPTPPPRRRLPRSARSGALVTALLAVVVLSGCTVPRPAGSGTIRYRDPLFTTVTKTADVQYGTAPDNNGNPVALKLDVRQPQGDTLTRRPAVIWVHGGGFSGGDKSGGPSADLADRFAKLGYVTFSINYRLLSSGCGGGSDPNTPSCTAAALAAISDAQGAVRFVREHAAQYGVDPTRIGIGGEYAGAITSAGVGMFAENGSAEGNPSVSNRVGGFFSISGGLPQGLFASSDDAPGVLVHGTADPTVPYQWSVDTAAALLKNGVGAFLEPLEGQGHVPYFEPYKTQIIEQADYFFYFVLDLAHAQGSSPAARQAFSRQSAVLAKQHPGLARRYLQHAR